MPQLRRASRRGLHVHCYSDTGQGDSGSGAESADSATLAFADGLRGHLAGIWGPTGGEDFSVYSTNVEFKDPLASYTGLATYKQALQLLKDSKISNGVRFQTHDVSVVGKGHVRARWTLSAECPLLPWKPRVVFTGVSVYTLDSAGKVVRHVDHWDSCGEDELPVLGGLRDIFFGGAGLWRAQPDPDFYMPPSVTLYRGKEYELRRLEDYRTVEMDYVSMPRSNKQAAVRSLNEYWAGANANGQALSPSQPTLIDVDVPTLESTKAIACFLPEEFAGRDKHAPAPSQQVGSLRFARKSGRIFAVKRIDNQPDPLDGWVSTEAVFGVRQKLLRALQQDGVKVGEGFKIARYAQVYGEGETLYELWIPTESFEMRAAPMLSAATAAVLPKIDLDFLKED